MPPTPRDPLERLWGKLCVTDDGCWLFTGHCDPQGYGRIHSGGRGTPVVYPHRLVYERLVGPIPEGLTLDHLCRVRRCCQPAHLEPVTVMENIYRGQNAYIRAGLAGTCLKGHTDDFYTSPAGKRQCRTCRRERQRSRAGRLVDLAGS